LPVKTPRIKWPAAYEVSRSDDGRLIACLGRNVVVVDVGERRRVSTSHPISHPSHSAFAPDACSLAVKATSGRIVVLDLLSGDVLFDHENQREGEGCNLAFAHDGSELVDGSWAGDLTVRNARLGVVRSRERFPNEMITRVSHDHSRHTWLVEHSPKSVTASLPPAPGYVTVSPWPFSSEATRSFRFGVHFCSATSSPDGARFCFIEKWGDQRICVARTSDGSIIASSAPTKSGGTGSELAWSDDGRYIASVQAREFVLLDAVNLSVVGSVPCQYPSAMSFLHATNELALGSWNTSSIVCVDDVIAGDVTLG
jgi:hypothetical protein